MVVHAQLRNRLAFGSRVFLYDLPHFLGVLERVSSELVEGAELLGTLVKEVGLRL